MRRRHLTKEQKKTLRMVSEYQIAQARAEQQAMRTEDPDPWLYAFRLAQEQQMVARMQRALDVLQGGHSADSPS